MLELPTGPVLHGSVVSSLPDEHKFMVFFCNRNVLVAVSVTPTIYSVSDNIVDTFRRADSQLRRISPNRVWVICRIPVKFYPQTMLV
jgi:hypothetical protein